MSGLRWVPLWVVWGAAALLALGAAEPEPVGPYDLGNRYFLQQKYSLALTNYEKALREAPNAAWAADAQFFVGQCLLRMGRKANAITAFETTIRSHPSSRRAADARVAAADIYASLGRWRDAMDHLTQAAKSPPGQPAGADGHYGLGVLYMEAANPERSPAKAIEHFQRVISGWPTSDKVPLAYLGMAQSHLVMGQTDEAARIAQQVIRKYPRSQWEAGARTLLGSALAVQGRPQEAVKQQQQAIENLMPTSPLGAQERTSLPPRFWIENFSRQVLPVPGPAGLAVQADSMSSDRNRLNLRGSVLIQAPPDTDLGRPFILTAKTGWIDTPGGIVSCSGGVVFDSTRPVPGSKSLDRIKVQSSSFVIVIRAREATARGNVVLHRWLLGKTETARGEQIVLSLKAGTYRIAVPQRGKKSSK